MHSLNLKKGISSGKVIVTIIIVLVLAIIASYAGLFHTSSKTETTEAPATSNVVSLSLDLAGAGKTLGLAVLSEENGNTKVALTLADTSGTHPAHIHTGTCGSNGPVKYQLSPVVGGKSETVLNGITLASLLSSPTYVNTHKSTSDFADFACANVKGTVVSGQGN